MHCRLRRLFIASAAFVTLGPVALGPVALGPVALGPVALGLVALGLVGPASAQPEGKAPALTAPQLPSPGTPASPTVAVPKSTTPPQPSAAQPILPGAAQRQPQKPTSPVVEEEIRRQEPLVVRKGATRRATRPVARPRRHAAHTRYRGAPIDRPALAGVELVAPLPPTVEGPHVTVPVPAYPVESIVARLTTPPPPIRCHPTRRDPYAPDPHLYKEVPVQCEPDED